MEVKCVLEQGRFTLPSSIPSCLKGLTTNLSLWRIWVHLWRRNPSKIQRAKRACFGCYTHRHTRAHTHTHPPPLLLALLLSPSACLLSSSQCTRINLQSFIGKTCSSKSFDHNSLLPNSPKQSYSKWPWVLGWAMKIMPLNAIPWSQKGVCLRTHDQRNQNRPKKSTAQRGESENKVRECP